MKKILIKLLSIIIFSYLIYVSAVVSKVFIASKYLQSNGNQEYLRFQIYGNSYNGEENTVSARFSIIDDRGNEISQIERSWNGNYLSVMFYTMEVGGKVFYFPGTIYSKDKITENLSIRKKGIKLEKYYNENQECILTGFNKNQKYLYTLSRFANKKYLIPTMGFVKTILIDLSDCDTESYYSIVGNKSKEIILLRM